ncbi:hypothetical protein NM688_g6160 [Phlebia brevispora]|uniref:Uncharacterized protein n=1 Tax=Phlebia brevispora TaxID=194682 RepID=A0ACC1SJA6_9APHY|nr:hypothetical protein NM688_g6160 [Phlebia brevispora]
MSSPTTLAPPEFNAVPLLGRFTDAYVVVTHAQVLRHIMHSDVYLLEIREEESGPLVSKVHCCHSLVRRPSTHAARDKCSSAFELSLLDSMQQALATYSIYYYSVLNYSNPAVFLSSFWSVFATLLLDVVEAFLLQSFLVVRIWRLSRNLWLTGICGILTLTHLGVLLVFPIRSFRLPNAQDSVIELRWSSIIGLSVSLVANIAIAVTMSFCLGRQRTGFKQSDNMITRLIVLTLTTGSLPFTFELGELVTYLISPTTFYDLFFSFSKSKLYVLSLLTILNTREAIRNNGQLMLDQINSIPLSNLGVERSDRSQSAVNIIVTNSIETDKTAVDNIPFESFES